MSCKVEQYLPDDDSLDEHVEQLVHSPKNGYAKRTGRGRRSFTPRGAVEMLVVTDDGQTLNLVAYQRSGMIFYTELHRGETKLRSLHNHGGHRNPGNQPEMENGHMHFPTVNRPLVGFRGTYAYEMDCPEFEESTDQVQFFCAVVDITIDELQLQLRTGGRR